MRSTAGGSSGKSNPKNLSMIDAIKQSYKKQFEAVNKIAGQGKSKADTKP